MKKRALLSLALILALLAALYLWYTRPRSFLAITGTSENAVCSAALLLLESWVDDGQDRIPGSFRTFPPAPPPLMPSFPSWRKAAGGPV